MLRVPLQPAKGFSQHLAFRPIAPLASGAIEKVAQLETAASEAGARLAARWEREQAVRERERGQREREAGERAREERR